MAKAYISAGRHTTNTRYVTILHVSKLFPVEPNHSTLIWCLQNSKVCTRGKEGGRHERHFRTDDPERDYHLHSKKQGIGFKVIKARIPLFHRGQRTEAETQFKGRHAPGRVGFLSLIFSLWQRRERWNHPLTAWFPLADTH